MKDPLYLAIEAHWREHRPKMVAALEAQGRLESSIERAAEQTAEAESAAIRNGLHAHEAQEMYRSVWAFLPSEEDDRAD